MTLQIKRSFFVFILSFIVVTFNAVASAGAQDVIPAHDGVTYDEDMNTHPQLKLTPDRSVILKMDHPVATVVVGNPNHVNVLVDSATRLIVVPRAEGASHFTAMDVEGNIVMQRHVIVAGEEKNYVRIRRGCGDDANCQRSSVYYCPDSCHEIIGVDPDSGSSDAAGAAADAAAGAAEMGEDGQEEGGEGDVE